MLSKNTITTIDHIILDLNDLVRDPEAKETLVQNVGVSPLINDFKQLEEIVNNIVVNKKDEKKAFNTLVEQIRRKTRIIMENEEKAGLPPPRFSKEVCNKIFETQVKMARIASVNNKDDSGKYMDPIGMMEIDDIYSENIVALSTGHLIDKDDLTNYFNRSYAFRFVGHSIQIRHPVNGELLRERDVADIRRQGVIIPEPPRNLLQINRALGLGGERIDGSTGGLLAFLPFNIFALDGAIVGYCLGALLGLAVIIMLINICPLPPAVMFSLCGIGVLGGMIERMKPDGGEGFLIGSIWGIGACMMVIALASLIVPPVISFLAAYKIIASIDMATKALPLIEAGIPVVLGVIGLVAEVIQRDSYERIIKGIYLNIMSLFTNIFGIIGAITGIIVYNVICRLCCRTSLDDARNQNHARPQHEEGARREARNSLDISRSLLASSSGNDDELALALSARQQRSSSMSSAEIHDHTDEASSTLQQEILESSRAPRPVAM